MTNKPNQPSLRPLLLRIAFIGVFGALAFVLTAFAAIPYGQGGYFNFGDVITLLTSFGLGPVEGALVGILSGAFADFLGGYLSFVPFTMAAKGLMGLLCGVLFRVFAKHKPLQILSLILGVLVQVLVYAIAYRVLYEEWIWLSSCFDFVQSWGCLLVSYLLFLPLEKTKIFTHL